MTPEERDKQLQNFLLKLAHETQRISSVVDGSALRDAQAQEINTAIDFVHRLILPTYKEENLILYENRRATRSFEVELERLWNWAIHLYLDDQLERLPPELREIHNQITRGGRENGLMPALSKQIKSITVPLLNEHKNAGEDLYLYIYGLMLDADEVETNELIAKSGRTVVVKPSRTVG